MNVKKSLDGKSHLIGWITLFVMMVAQIILVSVWAGGLQQSINDLRAGQQRQEAMQQRIESEIIQHLQQSIR